MSDTLLLPSTILQCRRKSPMYFSFLSSEQAWKAGVVRVWALWQLRLRQVVRPNNLLRWRTQRWECDSCLFNSGSLEQFLIDKSGVLISPIPLIYLPHISYTHSLALAPLNSSACLSLTTTFSQRIENVLLFYTLRSVFLIFSGCESLVFFQGRLQNLLLHITHT